MNPILLISARCRLSMALFFAFLLAGIKPSHAAPGDLVTVCFNEDGNDDFAILALVNIPGGSRYFITDSGWSSAAGTLIQEGSSPSPNRQIQFDVAPGGIPMGTVIKFDQSGANVVLTDPTLGTLTMVARFPVSPLPGSTKLSFSTAGDQLLIYQTAGGTVGGAVTMVSAFNGSGYTNPGFISVTDGWQVGTLPQSGQTGATAECNAPAGLIVYNGANASTATALGLASFPVSGLIAQDNYKYNGPYGLADKTAYLTAINNPANWVANDTVPYDLSSVGPGPGAAEINVQGNGVNIVDGSTTPQAADNTLFGSTPVTGSALTRLFTLQNVGTANLTIPAGGITFSGANANEFSLSGILLPATLPPGTSSNLLVTFDPTAAGIRTAQINIVNNDSNENPYNFAIQGHAYNYTAPEGTAPPPRWVATVQSNNVGAVRGVGNTTNGDIVAISRIATGTASNLRVTRYAGLTGAALWSRDLDAGSSDDINDVFVSPTNGDTFIAARASTSGNLNWYVHKVNGNGTAGWTYAYDGPSAGADECFAIARASDGNVVAVGMTTTASGSFARAAKLDANTGGEINSYVSPVNLSQFNGVAADAAGNVFATGFINDAVNPNAFTVKLSSRLGLIWSQTFDGGAALADSFSHVVALSPSGDCVVGGTTRTSSTNTDVILIRYAAAFPGNEVWRRNIAGAVAGSDTLNNLVTDANGDLYAAGSIRNVTSTDRDGYVSKVNASNGASVWITTRLGQGADSSDRFQNVRVSGGAAYAVGNLDNANRDIVLSRFNAGTGVEEWTTLFNGTGNGPDDVFFGKSVMTLLGTNALAIGVETLDVTSNIVGVVLKYAPFVPPVLSNVSKAASEDTGVAFAPADFTPAGYSDPDGQPLATVRITSLPANGLLKISGSPVIVPSDIPIANIATLTYTPNGDFNGADSFGWNASDGSLFALSTALMTLNVTESNDAPIAKNDILSDVFANSGPRTNPFAIFLANDLKGPANESAQALNITAVSNAVGGVVTMAGSNIVFAPTLNYVGPASFLYAVQDNGTTAGISDSKTSTATAQFNILPIPPGISCPATIATNAKGSCPQSIAFNALATGVPTPTVVYRLGSTPIASPFPFPVGTHIVTVTASNGVLPSATCSFAVIVIEGDAPKLSIARQGANAVVTWSNQYPCYALQYASEPLPNRWLHYPGPFATNAGRLFVTNVFGTTNRFFRLSE